MSYTHSTRGGIPTTLAGVIAEVDRLTVRAKTHPRSITRSDTKHLAALAARADQLQKQRNAHLATAERHLNAAESARTRARSLEPHDNFDGANLGELRSAGLQAIERAEKVLAPERADRLAEMVDRAGDDPVARRLTARLIVTSSSAYRSAFRKSLRFERPIYDAAEGFALDRYHEVMYSEIRAASEAGSFGLAVPVPIDATIVEASAEVPTVAGLANNVTTISDVYKGVVAPAAAFTWPGESVAPGDDTPTFVQPSLPVYMAKSFIPWSFEIAEDWVDFDMQFAASLQRGWGDALANVTAAGSGSGQPTGLFTAMSATTANPSHVLVTTAGKISATDVRKAWQAMPERFKTQATWIMHEDVLGQIRNANAAGSQLDVVVDRLGTTIMGRPVVSTSYAPDFTSTTGSENFLVVADLRAAYTVATRQGMIAERVPDMRDVSTGRPLGQGGFLAYARVGATVSNPNAARILSNS